ncbi:MAG: thiolase family protein [Chlamydiota bacterium]|nr:thiolase family protein [Chlamydiota bacterium]
MTKRIAVIDGVRTPFCKANGVLRNIEADDLGAIVVKELLARTGIDPNSVDELIFGNVLQPPHATNIARVLAVKGGLPEHVPALTVNRNCASGMDAIANASNKIFHNEGEIFIVGGCESMSHFPVIFSNDMREWLFNFSKAKGIKGKLGAIGAFRPKFLAPVMPKIADPLCGLTMGQTAEILSRDFRVTREEQDNFALKSQQRAAEARKSGRFSDEIVPIPLPPKFGQMQEHDDGPRDGQTIEGLNKLKPVFDKLTGTVTAGTSSQVTDGAVALLIMSEEKAKELGYSPIGYITEYSVAGLDPSRMGLGPAYATAKLLKKTGAKISDFDLIEINEAFAAQVLAVIKALKSDEFSKKELGWDHAVGEIDEERLNVNGGAIALGHPLGASGARIVLTLIKELQRRNKKRGLATLCVGGGQGQAMMVEV